MRLSRKFWILSFPLLFAACSAIHDQRPPLEVTTKTQTLTPPSNLTDVPVLPDVFNPTTWGEVTHGFINWRTAAFKYYCQIYRLHQWYQDAKHPNAVHTEKTSSVCKGKPQTD